MKTQNTYFRIQEELLEQLRYKDIHSIKVKDIALTLDINRATFYKHYDSVYHVLQEIEDTYLDGLDKVSMQMKQYPLDNKYYHEPHPAIMAVLEYIDANREKLRILYGPYGDPSFMQKCNRLVEKHLYQKGVTEKRIVNSELINAYLVGGQREMLLAWIKNDTLNIEDIAISTYRMAYGQLQFSPSDK